MSTHTGIPLPPVTMAVAALVQRLIPKGARAQPVRAVGAVVAAILSTVVMLATLRAYARSGTTVDPNAPAKTSVLITSGTNGFSRNPVYLGLAGLLAAHALNRGRTAAWLPVAGFVAVVTKYQIAREEQALRAIFGDNYVYYCSTTPRWVGPNSFKQVPGDHE